MKNSGPWAVDTRHAEQRSEPFIKLPWPVTLLIGCLLAAHGARLWLGIDVDRFALTDRDLSVGRWGPLVTHLFVHVSWIHVLMNSVAILAFGPPVARILRTGLWGGALFIIFFLICGVIAAGGFAAAADALNAFGVSGQNWALVGASGAASGLVGAATRLIDGRGGLGPLGGRTVVGMSLLWFLVNAVFGLTGLTPGSQGMPVAWEAHIIGFFVGLILIAPFCRLAMLTQR